MSSPKFSAGDVIIRKRPGKFSVPVRILKVGAVDYKVYYSYTKNESYIEHGYVDENYRKLTKLELALK